MMHPVIIIKRSLMVIMLVSINACATNWSEKGANGVLFQDAEPACRLEARASASRQLPTPYDRDIGPAGNPSITRHDIEERETARCLLDKGFTR